MSEGTEDVEARKPSKYKGFRQQGGRVRPQGRPPRSAVQQALIRFSFKHPPLRRVLVFLPGGRPFGITRGCRASGERVAVSIHEAPEGQLRPPRSSVQHALTDLKTPETRCFRGFCFAFCFSRPPGALSARPSGRGRGVGRERQRGRRRDPAARGSLRAASPARRAGSRRTRRGSHAGGRSAWRRRPRRP